MESKTFTQTNAAQIERDKYQSIWAVPAYGNKSFGEEMVTHFSKICGPFTREHLIDIGCGQGKATRKLLQQDCRVDMLDITDEQIPDDLKASQHITIGPVWEPWNKATKLKYDWGYCVDVMEHIPPHYVMWTLSRIFEECTNVFFHISLVPDSFGQLINQPLHLTVMPFQWWRDRIAELATITDCRDLLNHGLFIAKRS